MKHPNAMAWFRFHAGDLPFVAWLSFRLHALRCKACGERLRTELAERTSVLAALDEKRGASRPRSRAWIALPAIAATAVIVLLVRPARIDGARVDEDGMRAKGGSAFVVFVAGANDAGTLVLGETCRPGDALQAEYRSEKPWMLVVGVDPENSARALLPLDGKQSMSVSPGVHTAPQSWVLDEARGRERFVAFFSDEPLDAATAKTAALEARPRLDDATVVVRECTKAAP